VRDFVIPGLVGSVVVLALMGIWSGVLYLVGKPIFVFGAFRGKMPAMERRARIRELGKFRYYLVYGVLGSGLPVGLGMVSLDLFNNTPWNWRSESMKLLFMTLLFSALSVRSWSEAIGESVSYPPKYE
jgi:hypothetical protein